MSDGTDGTINDDKVAEAIIDEAKKKLNGAANAAPIKMLHYDDIQKPLDVPWRVKDFIPSAAIVLIVGESGCGKTFLVMDLSLHIASGQPWFGRKTKQGRVVYIAAEAGTWISNRIIAWKREKGCDLESSVDFSVVISPVDLCDLKKDDVGRLVAAIGSADVVIVDTVSRALAGGNENAPEDMGAFVTALDQLRDKLGCAVIAVHHLGKDASRGGRGHSLLHCAVDTEIEVELRGVELDTTAALVTKQREGPAGTEVACRIRQVVLGDDQDGHPITSCVIDPLDYVPVKKPKEQLKGQNKLALELLEQAIKEKGEEIDFGGQVEVAAVRLETWKEYMEKNGTFGEKDTFRSAWRRILITLEKNHIQIKDEPPVNKERRGWVCVTVPVGAPQPGAKVVNDAPGAAVVDDDYKCPF
jgi:KaiC/GvpD/RAD55 family RecA-like ATPase